MIKLQKALQRYENIQELLNSIKEWTESPPMKKAKLVDKSLGSLSATNHLANRCG